MSTTQKMIAAVAIVAVLAVAAVGAGFAYTASTSNVGNTTDTIYLQLSQGNAEADYASSFDDRSITYDTYKTPTNLITFFSGVDNEGSAVTAAYVTIDGAVVTASNESAYNTALGTKKTDFIQANIMVDIAKRTLQVALSDASIVVSDIDDKSGVDSAIDGSSLSADEKTALKALNTAYDEAKTDVATKATAAGAINSTNAAIYSLGSKTLTVTATGLDAVPIYAFSMKASGLDYTNYRYFAAFKDASDGTAIYKQITADDTLVTFGNSSAAGKTSPVVELFVAEMMGVAPSAEDLVLESAYFTFQIENVES